MLTGITDIAVAEGPGGAVLYATTRGGGVMTRFELGDVPGATGFTDSWQLSTQWLQLESPEIILRRAGGYDQVLLAGLRDDDLWGRVDTGSGLGGYLRFDAGSFDMGLVSEIALIGDGGSALAALRGGGLAQLDFGSGGAVSVRTPTGAPGLAAAQADGVATVEAGGTSYAIVTYGALDRVALLRADAAGDFDFVAVQQAGDGLWIDQPGAVRATTGPDGLPYVIVAASGSDSLTVLRIDGNRLVPVDHLVDSLDTRFADVSCLEVIEIAGQPYVIAAGSDQGLTVFALLPGGQLAEVATLAASLDAPINGLTDIAVHVTGTTAQIFVSMQAEPYLVEFSFSLLSPGETQVGGAGGDVLSGTGGDDILAGLAGDDRIAGGAGDDILVDGPGNDTLTGQAGADTFVLQADGAIDRITDFEPWQDRIEIQGADGTSDLSEVVIISHSWGAELRLGEEVLLVYSSFGGTLRAADFAGMLAIDASLPVSPDAFPDAGPDHGPEGGSNLPDTQDPQRPPVAPAGLAVPTIVPTISNPRTGGGGADTIQGGSGADQITARGGNDLLSGGGGGDILIGDGGFDTIRGGLGDDLISGGGHADSLMGEDGHDRITGGQGFDILHGGAGNDSLWGGSEPDRLYGGPGNDWISAGTNFGLSVDGAFGEAGDDTIFGDGGFDLLRGGTGQDLLYGGDQADNLFGDEGHDTLLGGQGLDRLFGGGGDDSLFGGEGNDGHFGEAGNDTAWGGTGNDRFFGGAGDDLLMGGDGVDTLYGNAGFDTIVGGAGDDLLWGNFNADRFVFVDGHGHDRVMDFDPLNALEVLDFSGLNGFTATTDVMQAARQEGRDVVIVTGADSSIRLVNVDLADLDGTDFLF